MKLGKVFFMLYTPTFSNKLKTGERPMSKSTAKATTKCTGKAGAKKQSEKEIEFSHFAPQAKKVGVGGCFNGWNPAKAAMVKDKDGNWKASLKLPLGRYEYRFCVDGDWQNDHHAKECVPNAFGSWNCVIEVR
jgi:1,4-alpha-glucan branching enzyme